MKHILLLCSIAFTFYSCKANPDKTSLVFGDNNESLEPPPPVNNVVNYSNVKSLVFIPKCLSCHSQSGGNAGGVNLENFENTLANLNLIKSEVTTGSMPPRNRPALTENEKSFLLTWINAGGPLEGVQTPPPPTVELINFEMVNSKVLVPRCISCHSESGGNRGDVNLETYENVVELSNSIESEIESGSMPPRNKPLTTEQKNLILKWISMGSPKN